MSESDIAKEQILREVYFNPLTGYGSREQLYRDVRAKGVNVSWREVKEWLGHQSTHTRFKASIKKFKRRQTYSLGSGLFAQIDLVDMSAFESENDAYRRVLTTVDVFSRYAICVPIRRKFAKFTRPAVETFLDKYVEKFGREPEKIQSDDGGEFVNQNVLSLFQERGITHYSTRLTGKKAAVVERFNKSLKSVMWKYFHKAGHHKWVDVLQDLVANINSRLNRSIGMAPDEVTHENSYEVFARLYGKTLPYEEPKYKVGDRVRLSEYAASLLNPNKKTFRKGYLTSFTEQIFVVTSVSHGSPKMYHLKFGEGEKEGDELKGKFYQAEMSRAEPPQE